MQKELERCNYLLNISTNVFIETNANGIVKYRSVRARYVFASEIEGTNILDYQHPEEAVILKEKIFQAARYQISGLTTVNLLNRSYNMYTYGAGANCLICVEDITERRQLSNTLNKTTQRLDFAEKIAKIGYWELDFSHKKLYWSAEMFRIFGVPASQASPKRNIIREQILKEDLPLYKEKLGDLIRNSHQVEGQVRIRRPNGILRYCFFKAGIINDDGQRKIAGTFQDLTPLIETQMALEKARKLAEDMNRAKSYFLAQASHDLRQPMQALSMFISALTEERLNPRQTMLINKIEASADNLKNLLDNLLDLSKIESGGVKCECINFNIGNLLKKIAAEYNEIAKSKNISFHYIPHNVVVFNDPLLVERIIRNLLTNAFKYTRNKIILGCKWHGGYIRIIISDNGVGIKAEEQEKIFDEFYQSNEIPENRRNGAGLGLTIVKRISDIIGTTVKFDSVAGQGTCFYFDLPIIRRL